MARFVLPHRWIRNPDERLNPGFVQDNFEALEDGVNGSAEPVPEVTSLPTNPVNRMVVDYVADATNGVVWRFRYRAASASANKWETVGGTSLYNETSGATTASDTLVSVSGPSIVVPLTGDYRFTYGFYGMLSGATNGGSAEAQCRVAATATGRVCRAGTDTNIGADGARFTNVMTITGPHAVTAGNTVDVYGRRNSAGAGGGTAYLNNMWLDIQPVRVS